MMAIGAAQVKMDAANEIKNAALAELGVWNKAITRWNNEYQVAEVRKDNAKLAELDAYAEECNPKIEAAHKAADAATAAWNRAHSDWAALISEARVAYYKAMGE